MLFVSLHSVRATIDIEFHCVILECLLAVFFSFFQTQISYLILYDNQVNITHFDAETVRILLAF